MNNIKMENVVWSVRVSTSLFQNLINAI